MSVIALNGVLPSAAEMGNRPNPLNLIRIMPAEGLIAESGDGDQSSIQRRMEV